MTGSTTATTTATRSNQKQSYWTKYYKPVYKTNGKDSTLRPYYGNGKWSRPGWICLHVLVSILILLLILLPYAYFVYFPSFLQYSVDQIGVNGNTIAIRKQSVGLFTSKNVSLAADIRLKPWSVFPLPGGFGANTMEIVTLNDEKRLLSISVPAAAFMLNQEIVLDTTAVVSMDQDQIDNVAHILSQISTPQGIPDFGLKLKLDAPITSMGMTLYKSLPLYRDIPLGNVGITSLLSSLLAAPTPSPSKDQHPAFEFVNQKSDDGAALHSMYSNDQIMNLGGLDLVWKSLDLNVSDVGPKATLGASFANWSPFTVSRVESAGFYLGLEGVKVAKIELSNLELRNGLNGDFKPSFGLKFLEDDSIDATKVQAAIEKASQSYASSSDFNFGVMGPIKITNADWIREATKDLHLEGSFAKLSSTLASTSQPLLTPNVMNQVSDILLGNSTLRMAVGNEKIEAFALLDIPPLSFLKPPKEIGFPYNASISIYAANEKAIDVSAHPLTVKTKSDYGFIVDGGIDVVPVNTPNAAQVLADSLNPILAANPTNSSIGIKDLFIHNPETGTPFKWTSQLFGQRILNIGLAPLNKSSIISLLSKTASTPSLIQTMLKSVKLAQLSDRSGFGAALDIGVNISPRLPKLDVDLGFINVDATVQSTKAMSLELNGLQFTPSISNVSLNTALIVHRNESLTPKLQNLINQVVNTTNDAMYVGVDGLAFGSSIQTHIITFSKVAINVPLSLLQTLGQSITVPALELPSKAIKLEKANLKIASSALISTSVDTILSNPSIVSASLGSIFLDVLIDSEKLASVGLGAINLVQGSSPTHFELSLSLGKSNSLSSKVQNLYNTLVNDDKSGLESTITVTGLLFAPVGVSSGPAVIDQFKDIKISLKLDTLAKLLEKMKQDKPIDLIDFSALEMDSKTIMQKVNPSLKYVKLVQQPNSQLSSGLDAHYSNPLPVSASIPYLSLSAKLDATEIVNLEISNIDLVMNDGVLKPRIEMHFKNGISASVSKLVNGILNDKIDSSLVISNIQFGSLASDSNDLISKINLDLSPQLKSSHLNLKKNMNSLLDSVSIRTISKRDVAGKKGPIVISGPFGTSMTMSNLGLELLPSKTLSIDMGASLKMPFPVDISLPYLSTFVDLDGTRFVDLIAGLEVAGSKSASFSSKIKLNDVPEIAEFVGRIVKSIKTSTPLPGTMTLGGILMGSNAKDYNDGLSALFVSLPLSKLSSSKSVISVDVDSRSIIDHLNLNVHEIAAKTLAGRKLQLNVGVGLNMPFPITLKGFNYLTGSVSLDSEKLISLDVSRFSLTPKSLDLAATSFFPPSSEKMKAKLGSLSQGDSSKVSTLSIRDVGFGNDQSSSLRLFSGIDFAFSTKDLLETVQAQTKNKNNLDIKSIANDLFLQAFKLRVLKDGLSVLLAGGLSSTDINADVAIGFLSTSLLLNNQRLLDFKLTDPLTLRKNGQNSILATLSNTLSISNDPNVSLNVAQLVDALLNEKSTASGTIGATGFILGSSINDQIDTFSQVRLALDLQSILPTLRETIKKTLNVKPTLKINPTKVELDVFDQDTLETVLEATFTGLDANIDVEIPLAYGSVYMNDKKFVTNTIKDIKIKDKKVSTLVHLVIPQDTRDQVQRVFTILGNILWGVDQNVVDKVELKSLGMGMDESLKIGLLEKVAIAVNVAPLVNQVTKNGFGTEIINLDSSIEHEGIKVVASLTDLGFPLVLKNSIKSEAKWALEGSTDPTRFVTLLHASGPGFTLPKATLMLVPPQDVTVMVGPMREALVNLLTWRGYGDNARLGFLTLVGTNGQVFTRFDSAYFGGPSWLVAPPTFHIESNYEPPYKEMDPSVNPIYFSTTISVINNSPLHLNVGQLEMYSESYDPNNPHGYHTVDESSLILELLCSEDLVIRNRRETGSDPLPVQALLHGSLAVFGYLDWNGLFTTAFAVDPDTNQPAYRTILRTRRNGEYVKWFDDFNYAMEDSHFTALLLPHFDLISQHLVYKSNVPSSLARKMSFLSTNTTINSTINHDYTNSTIKYNSTNSDSTNTTTNIH